MTFRKMVNNPTPQTTLAQKVESGVSMLGALKGAWDLGKEVVGAARVAAPYVARIASLI
jgi:hypothetical protein